MNRTTQQLLQYIRHNNQQQMHRRRQLVTEHRRNNRAHEQQLASKSLMSDKPKPKKAYHQGQGKYDFNRRRLYDWIASSKPTHFLTIQFPINMRSSSLDRSKDNLRRLMARFEQSLIGSRWTKSHLPFFAFAEKGPKDGYTYHFHILFNAGKYNTTTLRRALNYACSQLFLSYKTCYLEKIETYEIIYYCLKGIKITNRSGNYDTIILSSDLFNL